MAEQHYGNHARIIPLYHYGVLLTLLANAIWAWYRLVTVGWSGDAAVHALTSLAILVMAVALRAQTLTVQDRVIRLESQLRFREQLPADVAARASALPVKQLVAIRFAGDDELPSLIDDVLGGRLAKPKAIKQAVKQWRADHLRA